MSKATEKIDRFLDRYKQLCLEEGLFINQDGGDMYLDWMEVTPFEDSIDEIKNETINEIPWDKKWKGLDK